MCVKGGVRHRRHSKVELFVFGQIVFLSFTSKGVATFNFMLCTQTRYSCLYDDVMRIWKTTLWLHNSLCTLSHTDARSHCIELIKGAHCAYRAIPYVIFIEKRARSPQNHAPDEWDGKRPRRSAGLHRIKVPGVRHVFIDTASCFASCNSHRYKAATSSDLERRGKIDPYEWRYLLCVSRASKKNI